MFHEIFRGRGFNKQETLSQIKSFSNVGSRLGTNLVVSLTDVLKDSVHNYLFDLVLYFHLDGLSFVVCTFKIKGLQGESCLTFFVTLSSASFCQKQFFRLTLKAAKSVKMRLVYASKSNFPQVLIKDVNKGSKTRQDINLSVLRIVLMTLSYMI